ncbi:MAG: GtrA family protein [Oscillospiraceae bacterium]|nr:GtrA family protein [Oscillospiraceae bacterium]
MNKLLNQILRFGVVGIIATVLDYGLFLLLTELCRVHYLIANPVAFLVSVIVNYILSVKFVFDADKRRSTGAQFTFFTAMSAVGLGINELLLWLLSGLLPVPTSVSKLAATAVVMVYNFITRKLFLERKDGGN